MTSSAARACDVGGDVGRTAVYACEAVAFDGTDLEHERPFTAIAHVVHAVTSSSWWPGPTVTVTPARGGVQSSAAVGRSGGGSVEIRLAAGQMTPATAAHELAHALAGVDRGHDECFRRAYLDVVAVLTNLDPLDRRGELHVDQLADAFAAMDLAVGEGHWPPPDPGVVGAIAL